MRLLVDANLSRAVCGALNAAGYESVHVCDLGLGEADDATIFDHAGEHGLVVLTADGDFPAMLASRRATTPSVIHLRGTSELRTEAEAALVVANLPAIMEALEAGAVVSLSPTRLAVRVLPIEP